MKIKDILSQFNCIRFIGNEEAEVTGLIQLDENNTDAGKLMWINSKNMHKLNDINHGIIICAESEIAPKPNCHYIIVNNPRLYFKDILERYYTDPRKTGISPTAVIGANVKLGKDVYIGHYVVVEDNCEIGDHCSINHNTVIFRNTQLGKSVTIGSNCTIGGAGFGFEKDENGDNQFIPHIGNVVLQDYVEVGNNCSIDRAVMGSTILEAYVKLDNQVHVAHGVIVGKNSLLTANSMIAGSTHIGENCWVAPSSALNNKIKIGKNVFIGLGAVVLKDVADNTTVVGNPAKPLVKKTN